METPHSAIPGKPSNIPPLSQGGGGDGETVPLLRAIHRTVSPPPPPPPRREAGDKDSHTMSPLTLVAKSGLGAMETSLGSGEGKQ